MLALLLLCAYIIEGALYLGIGAVVCHTLGWPPPVFVVLAVLAAAGWRLVFVAMTFLVARYRNGVVSPEVRLRPAGVLWLVVGEYAALLMTFLWLQPLERLWRPPDQAAGAPRHTTGILFIHGYLCNGGFWYSPVRALRRRGLRAMHTVNLEPPFASLNRLARQVADYVDFLCEHNGYRRVILVGHSMGGLVARAALNERGMTDRVAKVVTLATPHHGTALARLGPGQNGQQMRTGSEWLERLNLRESPVPVTSIYALHDNLVAPRDSARLPGAKNIALAGAGHLALGFSPRVVELLYRELMVD